MHLIVNFLIFNLLGYRPDSKRVASERKDYIRIDILRVYKCDIEAFDKFLARIHNFKLFYGFQ